MVVETVVVVVVVVIVNIKYSIMYAVPCKNTTHPTTTNEPIHMQMQLAQTNLKSTA